MARVLVVDDEKSIRIVLREFLKKDGHEVQTAEDVPMAFELLEKHSYDVVVTDIIMPRYTGVDLLKKIHEKWPDIQVIMITGEPNVDTAVEAVRSGAYDYLSKPVNREAIRKVVGNAARLKALSDEKTELEKENRKYRERLEELVEERTSELSLANEHLTAEVRERKRAEELVTMRLKEKEVLLREIHHRVKNNMQVIQSLFGLQMRQVSDETVHKVFSEAQNRIMSMALVHEMLYKSKDLAKIDLNDYLNSLTKGLFQSFRVNSRKIGMEIDCKDLYLDINTAIPCGLVVNEIVTNSIKHAFPEERDGRIIISFHAVNGNFELLIRDDGIGIPEDVDFETSESLGLHLVKILVEGQLDGEIELTRGSGTEFRIRFEVNEG